MILLCCFGLLIAIGGYKSRKGTYKTSKDVVEALVYAYQDQSDTLLEACYEKSSESLWADKEIDFQKRFYRSVDASGVSINGIEELFKMGDYYCIGVSFDFLMSNKESMPYYEYYFVHNKENGNYKIVSKLDSSRDLIDKFEEKKDKIQEKSLLYQKYKKETEKFTSKNPYLAEEIYERFQNTPGEFPTEMEGKLRLMGVVFLMAIVELGALCILVNFIRAKRRGGGSGNQKISREMKGREKISGRSRTYSKADKVNRVTYRR